MRFSILFFVVLLGFLCLTQAQGTYEDCCLNYAKKVKQSMRNRVTSYRMQQLDGGCNLRAVIFTLKRGHKFCANPKDQWVKDIIQLLDRQGSSSINRKSVKG